MSESCGNQIAQEEILMRKPLSIGRKGGRAGQETRWPKRGTRPMKLLFRSVV